MDRAAPPPFFIAHEKAPSTELNLLHAMLSSISSSWPRGRRKKKKSREASSEALPWRCGAGFSSEQPDERSGVHVDRVAQEPGGPRGGRRRSSPPLEERLTPAPPLSSTREERLTPALPPPPGASAPCLIPNRNCVIVIQNASDTASPHFISLERSRERRTGPPPPDPRRTPSGPSSGVASARDATSATSGLGHAIRTCDVTPASWTRRHSALTGAPPASGSSSRASDGGVRDRGSGAPPPPPARAGGFPAETFNPEIKGMRDQNPGILS